MVETNNKKIVLSMVLKFLIIIGGLIGIYYGDSGFMGGATYLYFTIQSNLTIMAISLVFLIIDIVKLVSKKTIEIPNWLITIKFMFTVAISLTFLVFSLMLMPVMIMNGYASYLMSYSNIFCHNIVPILAIIEWLIFTVAKPKKSMFLYGLIMPLYYLVFALVCIWRGISFGNGEKFPYFFLNFDTNGWFSIGGGKLGVFYWIMIILFIVIFISWLLVILNKKIYNKMLIAKRINQ